MSVHRLHLQNWPPRVVAGYTTRDGGVSAGPHHSLNLGLNTADSGECVAQNRRRLRLALPELTEVRYLSQVHGTRVIYAPGSDEEPQAGPTISFRADRTNRSSSIALSPPKPAS